MSKNRHREEPVIREPIETPVEPTIEEPVNIVKKATGIVIDCTRLNVRKRPSMGAPVVCKIEKGSEVTIDDVSSTGDFYKVTTAEGENGYCVKRYIDVKPN